MEISAKELATKTGLDYGVSNGILRCMVNEKSATITKRPQPEGKRGKPTNIYHVDTDFVKVLVKLLKHPGEVATDPLDVV